MKAMARPCLAGQLVNHHRANNAVTTVQNLLISLVVPNLLVSPTITPHVQNLLISLVVPNVAPPG